jgi:imidazolonepropionase-like amidohydrolase
VDSNHLEAALVNLAINARLRAQPGAFVTAGDEPLPPEKLAKTKGVFGTWARILGWAKRYGVKVAFGTDLVFQPDGTDKQNLMLTRFSKIYSNIDT